MTTKGTRFDSFIKSCTATKGQSFTHTRIPDKELKVYGGAYVINEDKEEDFLKNYYEKVFVKGELEYMTEKQLIENGPILIDLDFRYESSITTRQHSEAHLIDMIAEYLIKLSEYVVVPEDTEFNCFVLEKKNVNVLDTKTKDGVHIIIGISVHKGVQAMLRDAMVPVLEEIWSDLPIQNTWDEVLDEGVSKGYVNWQLYGSRKPGHEAYLIKHHYILKNEQGDWTVEPPNGWSLEAFDTKKYFPQLCARYTKHPECVLKESKQAMFEEATKGLGRQKKKDEKAAVTWKKAIPHEFIRYDLIKNEEELEAMLTDQFDCLTPTEYKIRETHRFAMALPKEYYGPGSYNKWIRVGWALANTHPKMFLTWLKFSSQDGCRATLTGANGKFDWSNVADLWEEWKKFEFMSMDGLSKRSIMYWARQDSAEKYHEIRSDTIDYYIDQTVADATEFDLATVLYQLFKERFICVSIKNNVWYEYKNNRWFEIDSGNALRLSISREVHEEYLRRIHIATAKMQTMEQTDGAYESMRKRTSKLADIATLLKKTTWKNNIMREARELFYDPDFMDNLDQNPYLLCFNNYVIDFKNKCHRKGQPDDYISKCTNIDYVKLNPKKHGKTMDKLKTFMEQLFPIEELREYMWQHLASVLVGTMDNQTFNIYTGSGRNGKSCMVDLMSKGLGDYKGTVPITLITQKRNSIGSTSSEIVQLMGTRYAVMQEPSKGDKINEGIMKEITGGDPIQGRALFKDTVTFTPQFKLVVCTNTLFDIKSNDDGTWRRIRVCDFKSKFLAKPYEDDLNFPKEQYPYQYQLDKQLDQNFEEWAPIFMSMLVEKAYETGGLVQDCDIVKASSDEYREGQDYLAEFAKEKIMRSEGDRIKKTELRNSFKEWYQASYGRGVPNARELNEFMDKRYGKYRSGGWQNVKLIYDDDVDEIDEM
uniref:SF3 helicase domain-containing protein n=1 Tax=viral metagenome TaxID=1070528 RepID=A0A6C0CP16_9ZZZZ